MANPPEQARIALTPEEEVLLHRIHFETDPSLPQEVVRASGAAAAKLTHSLCSRNAIPQIRLHYFTDPDLNVDNHGKPRKSPCDRNSAQCDAIPGHPHFLEYLRYFLYGPDVPAESIARFKQAAAGTGADLCDRLCQCAKVEARLLPSRRADLPEEVFKLALECELDVAIARAIRDAVREAF